MKADISFPKVEGVSIVIGKELLKDGSEQWSVFVMNTNEFGIRNVLVTSKGYGEIDGRAKTTGILRHHVKALPPYSAMPIELIEPELFKLCNEFWVSYYKDDGSNHIFDKKFLFLPDSIIEENLSFIPILQMKGVMHG
jgi:hypothetical protein